MKKAAWHEFAKDARRWRALAAYFDTVGPRDEPIPPWVNSADALKKFADSLLEMTGARRDQG